MSDSIVDHRHRVLLYLKLLASTEAIERLVGSTEPEQIADRLCNLWIDELFVPGLRYRDGLKGDRSASLVREFETQFSTSEIALLEQFHRFLELRLEMLPKRRAEEAAFPRGDFWQSIIAHAGRVLEEIDPEGLELDAIVDGSRGMLRLIAPDGRHPGLDPGSRGDAPDGRHPGLDPGSRGDAPDGRHPGLDPGSRGDVTLDSGVRRNDEEGVTTPDDSER